MSCSTEEADNYYINGKEEYPSFFSFFYLFLYTRFRKSADHLNEQKLNYSCNYLGWSGKLERRLSERTPYTPSPATREVSVSCERESRMYTAATRANQERVDEREVEMQGDDLECAP